MKKSRVVFSLLSLVYFTHPIMVICALDKTGIPLQYDIRERWGWCSSFVPNDQGDCNSCSASALVSSLGIRACIRDRRNISFSYQRIWDCYSGSCENGVDINNFMFAIMYSDVAETMLKSNSMGVRTINASNASACISISSSTDTQKPRERIESIGYHKEWWIGLLNTEKREPSNMSISVRNMQSEILLRGPIIAILYLTPFEMLRFSEWKNKEESDVLYISSPPVSKQVRNVLHAVTVIGWGKTDTQELFYWKILNSFGDQWGTKGVGNIPAGFGLVEHEWYAVESTPVPCSEKECVFSADYPNSQATHADGMILSIPSLLPKEKRSGLDDGIVLVLTALGMLVVSFMICSLHSATIANKRKRLDIIDWGHVVT